MIVNIPIPEEAKDVVNSIIIINSNTIQLKLSGKYNNKVLNLPFNSKDFGKSLERIEKKVKEKLTIDIHDYNKIEDTICTEITKLIDKENNEIEPLKSRVTVNKYSNDRKGELYEAVLVDKEPSFAMINENKTFELVPFIDEKTRTLLPPSQEEYLHIPYEFESVDELDTYIKKCETEGILSMYRRVKSIVSKCIDQDETVINLISIDIVFSYFQDRFNTVHYTGVFGDNGTGKSSIGDVVEVLAYRAMNTTDPTPANIYRALGKVEAGQHTMIIDEAEKVDQVPEMVAIFKSGYAYSKKINRVNPNSGISEKYYAFCQKMIIGERPLGQNIAKGVLDRTFSITTYPGKPVYDIKEIINPTNTGKAEYKTVYEEIMDLRKMLFVYRIRNFRSTIPDIDIGIGRRNKELVKPYLQLFSCSFKGEFNLVCIDCINPDTLSDIDRTTLQEIKNTFKILVDAKHVRREATIEAKLLPIIIELAIEYHKGKTITYSDLWNVIKVKFRGYYDERRPNEYHTEDFGIIYRNTISNVIQKLGVETRHRRNSTELLFHMDNIIRTVVQYNIPVQSTLTFDSPPIADSSGEDCECCERSTDAPGINTKLESSMDIDNVSNISTSDRQVISDDNEIKNKIQEYKNYNNIYRSGKTDNWYCKKCKYYGDIWFMKTHPCKGVAAS
ncbi:hypothetical protein [Candidatus Nitrosocosmicus oleophilus]|uniref:hypothetical protein n=1 Tax=Candidatus Nitrosocosmicus oleophilus TaxID=1353260 RepID=UPI0018CB74CA|nr:hypothetical protein [Candidatus Nitrosocosmicus oleophilus]